MHSGLPPRFAAIDVGTNSFHLVVVKPLGNGSFVVLDKEKIVVRLGESASQIKMLSAEAIDRGVDAMRLFSLVINRMDAQVRAVATSAVREAENGKEFVRRVKKETGIEIEVISGFEEARLIFLGVLQALPVYDERITLFDIGGGSTEILVGERGEVLYANSFKIGAIRMTQRFFPEERITRDQVERLKMFVRGEIYFARKEVRAAAPTRIVASSGTAQTVAAMAIAAHGEEIPASLNGITIGLDEIRDVVRMVLKAKSHRERGELPGCDPRRADILAAGALVLETILEECGFDEVTISDYALREGIVFDAIRKLEGKGEEPAHLIDLRRETVLKIGRTYHFDEEHALQVARLSLEIFDELSPLHKLKDDSRELLEAAALLHDIGYYISHSSHHKHALYLITNCEMFGFTNDEIAVIANVARYHRKSHPKVRHPEFAALPKEDKRRTRFLAAILRVADGLDRTHQGGVRGVRASYDERGIKLDVEFRPGHDASLELWSVQRKKGLLEEVFGREVAIADVAVREVAV